MIILNTKFVKIEETETHYRVFIALSKGGWIEHNPFEKNIMGLTNAMQLATECCAGKFYPMQVMAPNRKQIGHEKTKLTKE